MSRCLTREVRPRKALDSNSSAERVQSACLSAELLSGRHRQRLANRRDELFVIKRFHEKCHGSDRHRGRPGGQIVARRHDDDLSSRRHCAESRQHFQAGDAVHPDVSYDERHWLRGGVGQEFLRLAEWPHAEAFGGQQIIHRSEDGNISVDQTNLRSSFVVGSVHAAATVGSSRAIAGQRTMTRAPRSSAFSPTIVPPCAMTIDRTIANPIPMPCFLVETKGSKILAG